MDTSDFPAPAPTRTPPGLYRWIMYVHRDDTTAPIELDRVYNLEHAEDIFDQCLDAYDSLRLSARLFLYTDADWDKAQEGLRTGQHLRKPVRVITWTVQKGITIEYA